MNFGQRSTEVHVIVKAQYRDLEKPLLFVLISPVSIFSLFVHYFHSIFIDAHQLYGFI